MPRERDQGQLQEAPVDTQQLLVPAARLAPSLRGLNLQGFTCSEKNQVHPTSHLRRDPDCLYGLMTFISIFQEVVAAQWELAVCVHLGAKDSGNNFWIHSQKVRFIMWRSPERSKDFQILQNM